MSKSAGHWPYSASTDFVGDNENHVGKVSVIQK